MTEPQIPLFEPDEDTLARDDQLLDALGSGVRLPGEDTIALALFMWREDLAAPPKAVAAERARRKKRRITWSIALGLTAVFGAGAAATAAYYAEPGTPLFPVTERVFTEQASTANAETAKERIADAQKAVDEQKLPEAKDLLDEAEKLIDKVTSLLEKQALAAELQRVRDLLNAALTGIPVPTPALHPTPTPGTGAGQGAVPTPSPEKSGGGLLPLPLPTITLPPLPSLPLPLG
jgi:hypothetical protein